MLLNPVHMEFKEMPLEAKADETFFDLVVKGAKVFSNGQPKTVERVSIYASMPLTPEDPKEIRLYASFSRAKPKYLSVTLTYDKDQQIPEWGLYNLIATVASSRYVLRARQNIAGWSPEKFLEEEPARIRIDSPLDWGFADVDLPKSANWIDTDQLCDFLGRLGLRYSRGENLRVKSLKLSRTETTSILSAYNFLIKSGFNVELSTGSYPEVTVKNEHDKQSVSYSICSMLGISKGMADSIQWLTEKQLSFSGHQKPYVLYERYSELKNKGMKIDYD
jgi:hypothetical protein